MSAHPVQAERAYHITMFPKKSQLAIFLLAITQLIRSQYIDENTNDYLSLLCPCINNSAFAQNVSNFRCRLGKMSQICRIIFLIGGISRDPRWYLANADAESTHP